MAGYGPSPAPIDPLGSDPQMNRSDWPVWFVKGAIFIDPVGYGYVITTILDQSPESPLAVLTSPDQGSIKEAWWSLSMLIEALDLLKLRLLSWPEGKWEEPVQPSLWERLDRDLL